jgi:hypothetical protein
MKKKLLAGTALAALLVLPSSTSAVASPHQGRTTMDVSCAGQVLTITSAAGKGGDNWGAAQVSDGGHLVLVALHFTVEDDTAGVTLEDETVGHGAAHAQQDQISCEISTEQATLGDLVDAGFDYPPGTAPTDVVTMAVHATVVARP